MKIEKNPWVNVDFPDVIRCREKYIPAGKNEKNVSCDITDHRWFEEVPFDPEKGIGFLAAGVFHYLTYEAVKELVRGLAERFPGGLLVFDFVSEKGMTAGNTHVKATDNDAKLTFSMENAEKEIPAFSGRVSKVLQKSYMEGYPVHGAKYNFITQAYIKSKRGKYFVAHVEFAR
ncbi:MAG: class I SAM-dependent methyltransferase [Eubacteriales bacterium]|nr:class I SAM-dependent methyltransferase [Eubacteriales bacterium]